ncbi:class I SAM-dependent methyltransferase [Chitiniphilus eburneus]|uniref:Class I SAM-dependent methyltransferase n=1 Tax=Chitiniphilus eburneus TaxID=2571148 RepID=A0A4U0Q4T4_9NEIS|nr:class I SAM-dependent methyltransferase [Chitiniphilus eburneus]TJZ76163.1 class I SAM-dependent methyltransferase [Chitiniphilus eburneus]
MSQMARLLALQGAACLVVLAGFILTGWPVQPIPFALLVGISAAIAAPWLHQGRWWRLIHLLFPLAVAVADTLAWPAWYWGIGLIALLLLYGGVVKSRVPLFLSNARTLALLSEHIPPHARFLDLGAGTGTVLAWLARHRPDVQSCGVETAWLPWLIGRLRLRSRPQASWLRRDLFSQPLAGYDVVYAYLSPVAMPALWDKINRELPPGALFVSNSFAVPDQPPLQRLEVGDWKGSELLLWRR